MEEELLNLIDNYSNYCYATDTPFSFTMFHEWLRKKEENPRVFKN